ncbi:hypothetical protein EDD98_4913 [Streptomyces sp. PanSC19]|nr:hypothetical protein EDD98_4913 [Streptomyces sp. PanSC19]
MEHPRLRGDHPSTPSELPLVGGTPPLARGPSCLDDVKASHLRSTPTRVGTRSGSTRRMSTSTGHPRSRGDRPFNTADTAASYGAPPLARGPPGQDPRHDPDRRSTPARAGTTWPRRRRRPRSADHPCSRGDHCTARRSGSTDSGPPSLVRGPRLRLFAGVGERRTTPARAGTTTSKPTYSSTAAGHPRSRRDHWPGIRPMESAIGPPPLARGPHDLSGERHHGRRIIPARAGTIPGGSTSPAPAAGHPRSRGEHARTSRQGQRTDLRPGE